MRNQDNKTVTHNFLSDLLNLLKAIPNVTFIYNSIEKKMKCLINFYYDKQLTFSIILAIYIEMLYDPIDFKLFPQMQILCSTSRSQEELAEQINFIVDILLTLLEMVSLNLCGVLKNNMISREQSMQHLVQLTHLSILPEINSKLH